jgi:SAM-dependent methyltransferase
MGVLLGKSLHSYYIMAVLIGKYCSPTIMVLLLTLILLWLYFYWKNKKHLYEGFSLSESGFSQDSPYVISSDVYDDFYVQIYDSLMLSQQRASQYWDAFTQGVQPFQDARFLDVGSGTGAMVAKVLDAGFDCVGVDSSLPMIHSSLAAYPTESSSSSRSFLHASVMDPMLFERNEFFGVFCLGMTLYEFSDTEKLQFFKNSYFWIRPGGYLLLHLVDSQHFSTLLPVFSSRAEGKGDLHLKDYTFDLDGFSYRKTMQMVPESGEGDGDAEGCAKCSGGGGGGGGGGGVREGICSVSEYFTDHASSFVRQNDSFLHFASRSSILKMASHAGFLPVGVWNLQSSVYSDPHQFLYLLERTL